METLWTKVYAAYSKECGVVHHLIFYQFTVIFSCSFQCVFCVIVPPPLIELALSSWVVHGRLWVFFNVYSSWMNGCISVKLMTAPQYQVNMRGSLGQRSRSEILWTPCLMNHWRHLNHYTGAITRLSFEGHRFKGQCHRHVFWPRRNDPMVHCQLLSSLTLFSSHLIFPDAASTTYAPRMNFVYISLADTAFRTIIFKLTLFIFWPRNVVAWHLLWQRLSVCPSVCLSQPRVTLKPFKISEYALHLTIEQCR